MAYWMGPRDWGFKFINKINVSHYLFRKSANNVIKFSAGEKHIVYITNRHEAFGIGNSILGQLGYYQSIESSLAEP